MARKKAFVPAKQPLLDAKLPTIEVTSQMRSDVEEIAALYKEELGQAVSRADVVRWAVASFIAVKLGR